MEIEAKIRNRIDQIKNSGVLRSFIQDMSRSLYTVPNIQFGGREKDFDSALKKFIDKGYENPDQITDLAGAMAVTTSVEDVYKVAAYIKENFNVISEPDDYIKNPKLGYQSYHMNIRIDGINIELQIKTQDMKKAQKYFHDNFYKNDKILPEVKKEVMTQLYPALIATPKDIFEKNQPMLQEFVTKHENLSFITPGQMANHIKANVNEVRDIFIKDLRDKLNTYIVKAGALKTNHDRLDIEFKRLDSADYWQKDYSDNLERLEILNTPVNKFKMLFSKSLKEEYKKTLEDISYDKKFLKVFTALDRNGVINQNPSIDISDRDRLHQEFNEVTSAIDAITKAINDMSRVNDMEQEIPRVRGIDR